MLNECKEFSLFTFAARAAVPKAPELPLAASPLAMGSL